MAAASPSLPAFVELCQRDASKNEPDQLDGEEVSWQRQQEEMNSDSVSGKSCEWRGGDPTLARPEHAQESESNPNIVKDPERQLDCEAFYLQHLHETVERTILR